MTVTHGASTSPSGAPYETTTSDRHWNSPIRKVHLVIDDEQDEHTKGRYRFHTATSRTSSLCGCWADSRADNASMTTSNSRCSPNLAAESVLRGSCHAIVVIAYRHGSLEPGLGSGPHGTVYARLAARIVRINVMSAPPQPNPLPSSEIGDLTLNYELVSGEQGARASSVVIARIADRRVNRVHTTIRSVRARPDVLTMVPRAVSWACERLISHRRRPPSDDGWRRRWPDCDYCCMSRLRSRPMIP